MQGIFQMIVDILRLVCHSVLSIVYNTVLQSTQGWKIYQWSRCLPLDHLSQTKESSTWPCSEKTLDEEQAKL